jgi:DNA helicase-2/ATP-dependent DNA helicase PcrA
METFSAGYQDSPVSELISAILDQSGYEQMLRTEGSQERLDNLAELKQSVYEYESSCGEEVTLEHYLKHVAMLTNTDAASVKNAVKMMTVHTAKGLEFAHVFICGMSEGIFPSKKTATLLGMEEERRLAFVAFTRAKESLYLTDAEGRNLDGSFRYPSRFIFNVDKHLLCYTEELSDSLVSESGWHIGSSEKSLESAAAQSTFIIGDRVVHSVMGAGEIVDIDQTKAAYKIQFDELGTVRGISFKAKLSGE